MDGIQLAFGQVRHTRLRPALNRFNYGVYYLRLPLRSLFSKPQPPKSARLFSLDRFNLLSFHQRDHGDASGALLPWIDTLLSAEGIHDADGEIWLQAFPRVLGFVFNPVSFWFCHRSDGALRAILCEVRNTFGEKHYYLLDHGGALAWGTELAARKVFHVSPFCATEGGYRFRFMRRIDADGAERSLACIDHDDAQGALLQTSITGRALGINDRAVLWAFLRYPLMTAAVVLRIHLQALRLWYKRVRFFRKPSPPIREITR